MRIFSSEAHVTEYSFYSTNSLLALITSLKLLYFGFRGTRIQGRIFHQNFARILITEYSDAFDVGKSVHHYTIQIN